ncbi:MAG: hypothetical protein IIB56_09765 [Planctomycetes bacterium]|nr:hypothetical protein [Planctomycetota bacterium]
MDTETTTTEVEHGKRRGKYKTRSDKGKARSPLQNPEQILELRAAGVSIGEIAELQGVGKTKIWAHLAESNLKHLQFKDFGAKKANFFEYIQAGATDLLLQLQGRLRDQMPTMSPSQITNAYNVLSLSTGLLDDKIRLHRGQSTANISVVTRLASEATESILAKAKDVPEVSEDTE